MATDDFKRKLAAVFSADVVGYSRLMSEDESETVRTLKTYKEIMSTLIKQHRGRVVDSPGDNLLAEFVSVVDGVQCAVSVQKEFQARNAKLPKNRRMEFRIGINLGDVIEDENRIYGDGVNVAARLEALADPGGICVSKTSFDHIESKLPLGYEYLGQQRVKNIPKPVGVYRVVMEPGVRNTVRRIWRLKKTPIVGIAALSMVVILAIWYFYFRPAPPPMPELPDKPSIAVLPFKDLSGEGNQEYFSDGLTINIITQLYKMPHMFVIAPQSSFKYRDKALKVEEVGRELGVRYVLEGSVQRAGKRIRINAHLTDTQTGNQLWAERYDREQEDVFAVQDEIIRKVITETGVKVSLGESIRLMAHSTKNFEALDCLFKAYRLWQRFDKESNAQARELLEKAIELDPKFAMAIAFLGYIHRTDAESGWVKNPDQSWKRAEELANRALAIDDTVFLGYMLLGGIYAHKRLYEQAIAAKKRAIACEPNNAVAINSLGNAMIYAGRPEEALELSRQAKRLSPYPPPYFFVTAGMANYLTGRYEEAISEFHQLRESFYSSSQPDYLWVWLIASYMELGREKDARAEVRKLIDRHPDFSIQVYIESLKKSQAFKDYAFLDRHVGLLRRAGMK